MHRDAINVILVTSTVVRIGTGNTPVHRVQDTPVFFDPRIKAAGPYKTGAACRQDPTRNDSAQDARKLGHLDTESATTRASRIVT
jgi:hypothetical protein